MRKENESPFRCRSFAFKTVSTIVLAAGIITGYFTAPEDTRLPVMLADGQVIMQPCFVAVEGECIALVEDEAAANEVIDKVKEEYETVSTTKVEIEESTSVGCAELKNGDEKPEILTVDEASDRIVASEAVTVKTVELIEEEESVDFEIIEEESDQLAPGQAYTRQEGENGLVSLKKEVLKENGEVVSETVVSTETLKETVPEIIVSGAAELTRPLDYLQVTSHFGPRWGRIHNGIDLGAAEGTSIYAAGDGVVTCAEYKNGFGNLVIIDHGNGLETYYAHCSSIDVAEGESVAGGQSIAAVGSTGNSTGPHLHFEVRIDGNAQDPADWIQLEGEENKQAEALAAE